MPKEGKSKKYICKAHDIFLKIREKKAQRKTGPFHEHAFFIVGS